MYPVKISNRTQHLFKHRRTAETTRISFQTMIVVRTIINVLPEKQREVLQTLLSLIASLEKEKGCLSYDIYSDIEDESIFNLISEWESRQSLDDHLRSDRFSILLGIKSLLCEPLRFEILTVSNSEGAEAVNIARKKCTDFSNNNVERSLPG